MLTGNKAVVIDVTASPLGQKYVGFIQQEYTVPSLGEVELLLKLFFDLRCFDTEITTCNGKERLATGIGYAFCDHINALLHHD